MRKVLSLVLILSLVMGSFGFAFAADGDKLPDVVGTDYEEAVNVLYALDVVSGYENTGLYMPENVVTRAEMAVLIIRQLGLADSASGNTSSFPDMDGYGWAEGYIGYAQQLGVIAGYPDGTFKPGNTVTYDEALTMIVSAIGYTQACREMRGEWPAIFVAKANELSITDDVSASGSAGAKRGDIAIYLYNALTCVIGYPDGNGNFKPRTDKDMNELLMINNLGAEEVDYTVISGDEDSLINIKPYIGQSAKTFQLSKGKQEGYVLAVGDVRSEEITGVYDAKDKILTAFDGTEYKLDNVMDDTQGKNTSKVKESVVEFENGDALGSKDAIKVNGTDLITSKGGLNSTDKVQLTMHVDKSSRTVNGIYSILFWDVTNDDVIEAGDLTDITSRQTLLSEEFALDDNDDIDEKSFQLYGVDSLDDIKVGNVVYVYTNKDDEISRIDVGTKTVEGEATRVNNSGEKVTVDGTVYEYSQKKLEANGKPGEIGPTDIDAGDEVALILDAYGYIYDRDYISSSGSGNYGVVLNAGPLGGSSKDQEVRMVLADGSEKAFTVAAKLFDTADVVPGVTNATGTGTGMTSDWDAKAGDIVKYSLDRNGKITDFENMTSSGKNYSVATASSKKVSKSGDYNSYTIADNAVIWTHDGKLDEYDDYRTATRAKILDSDPVDGRYVIYRNKIVAIVLYNFSAGDDVYGIAYDREKDSKGETDYLVNFWVDGRKTTYNTTETPYRNVDGYLDPSDFVTATSYDANGPLLRLKIDGSDVITGVETASQFADKGYVRVYRVDDPADVVYNRGRVEIKGVTASNAGYPAADNEFALAGKAEYYLADLYKDEYKSTSDTQLNKLQAGDVLYFYDVQNEKNGVMDVVVIFQN